MDRKNTGRIDRHKSDIDVMEHVIGGYYPLHRHAPEPRGHATDRDHSKPSGGQKSSQSRPKLRHK
jgi:hypothetical protein